jgi:hypothetical protein
MPCGKVCWRLALSGYIVGVSGIKCVWSTFVVASNLHFPFNSSCIVIEMALKPSHLFIYTDGTPMVNPLPIQALGSKNEFELQSCVIQYGEYIMLISFQKQARCQ